MHSQSARGTSASSQLQKTPKALHQRSKRPLATKKLKKQPSPLACTLSTTPSLASIAPASVSQTRAISTTTKYTPHTPVNSFTTQSNSTPSTSQSSSQHFAFQPKLKLNQPFHKFSKRHITSHIQSLLSFVPKYLNEAVLNAGAYSNSDKISKKKKPSGPSGGSSDNNGNNDSDDDDDDDKKDKKNKKQKKDKKTLKQDDKKDDKKDDSVKLGSVFDVTPEELERLSKESDAEDAPPSTLKKKEKREKKSKKEKDESSNDEKDKKSEDKKDGDKKDDEDQDLLDRITKLGGKDSRKKDEDEGPDISEKQDKLLSRLRLAYYGLSAVITGSGVMNFLNLKMLENHAQQGSYEFLRSAYLKRGAVERIDAYPDNIMSASLKNPPETLVDAATGAILPNPAYIPDEHLPSSYQFGVIDLDTFSRQLAADIHRLGVPDIVTFHPTYFGLATAFNALIIVTVCYILARRRIHSEVGWFNNKPSTSGLWSMGGMDGPDKVKKFTFVKDIKIRFKDVAGMEESKAEIVEFVDFLKTPDKYHQLGAKLPKGALLHGPPGTGKTLLAKAVAGEAGCPFIAVSGSDFVQMFVGMGSKRVRELFAQARKQAPCIIFIDEVDAIARRRDSRGDHDEREATLNQLLVEMDGFKSNEKIIVLAATNRLDMLDPAFIRPGRIDRKILIETPDLKGRADVFKVHLAKVIHGYEPDELSAKLAALTPGLSGADIENICNEGAITAARASKETIELADFEAAIDRVLAGLKKTGALKKDDLDRKIVAYHESGHAVAGWFLEHADPLLKVTITPRTNGALGFAQYMPKQSGIRQTEELYDRLCVALGGRAAEEIFFQKISTGASDDLKKVTNLTHQMITEWGMSDKLPNIVFPASDSYNTTKPMSDRTSEVIDDEILNIVNKQYGRVKELLISKKDQLELLSETLLREETINHDTIVSVLGPRPFENDEYINFMKQNKQKLLTQSEKALLGKADDHPLETTVPTNPNALSATQEETTPPAAQEATPAATQDEKEPEHKEPEQKEPEHKEPEQTELKQEQQQTPSPPSPKTENKDDKQDQEPKK